MSDTEHLIIAVERYPCLWDTSHEDYHNRDIKDLAWQAIAKEIFSDYDSFEGMKQKTTCNNLKKKWTYIRDYYRKDQQKINNTPSGSGAKAVKKAYAYASFLDFLKPTFQGRQTQGNYTDNDDNNLDTQQTSNEPNDLETSSSNERPNLEHDENIILNPKTTKKSTKKDIPQQILNILERRVPQVTQPPATKAPIEDDDVKFLLSFRGDMSKMTANQKFDFKIEMLQLVKRISNSESYSRPSSSPSLSNPGLSYISIPSPSPSNYPQAPSPLFVRRIDHRESPYSRATTQFRNSNHGTSTLTSSNCFIQAPSSSPIPQNTNFNNRPTSVRTPQTFLNITEENIVYNYEDNSALALNSQELDNSQIVALNSEEPMETYLSFKKNSTVYLLMCYMINKCYVT